MTIRADTGLPDSAYEADSRASGCVLTEADALADLLGEPRPTEAGQALPRPVRSEEAQALAAILIVHAGDHKDVAYECDMNPVHTLNWKHYETSLSAAKALLTLVSERDALAVRVRELEAERANLRGAISDAAYEYSWYILEDIAPRTLEKYMLEAFDAALTANTSGADHE